MGEWSMILATGCQQSEIIILDRVLERCNLFSNIYYKYTYKNRILFLLVVITN